MPLLGLLLKLTNGLTLLNFSLNFKNEHLIFNLSKPTDRIANVCWLLSTPQDLSRWEVKSGDIWLIFNDLAVGIHPAFCRDQCPDL